jgi:16S rRNA (adenine1518-N6/adenine1519-N6)-dimethyltransferase
MLRSSLKPLFGAEVEARLSAAGVAPTLRAEEIAVAGFLTLAGLSG